MTSCYQIQAKVIAVIEMVLATIFLILFGCAILLITTKKDEILQNLENMKHDEYPAMKGLLESSPTQQISIFLFPILYCITEFGLAILLYRSAEKSQHKRLRIWLSVTITLTMVGLVAYIIEIMRHPDFISTSSVFVVNFAFTVYSIWVVYCLIGEIKSDGYHHPVPYNAYSYKL